MYDYRSKNSLLTSNSHIVETSSTMKCYSAMGNLKNDDLLKNKAFSRNHRISNVESE